jgi:RNA polymerase sigma-70 factor (ECF subfamily)
MTARVRDDEQLLSALSDGDMGAMQTLYERHASWLSVRLSRRCNDREVVADVLQDTFVAVWRSASRFRGEGDVAAWLWGIAIRRLVSRLRSRQAVVVMSDVPEDPSRSTLAAEEQVLMGIEYGDLGRAMSRLSPEMRAVVQATVLDGLTTREAARLLGVPQNTVKTRLHRAKAQLRISLTEEGSS